MATRIQRPRIRPTWKGGLRRGRERNSTMQYLLSHPEEYARLVRILEESRAVNGPPLPLPPHVRTPIDFERR